MDGTPTAITPLPETVGALRGLIREAEARGSRLRLLLETARDLGWVDARALDDTLALAAHRLALFLGHRTGHLVRGETGSKGDLPVRSPGPEGRILAHLILDGPAGRADGEDARVREVVLQQIGAAIDRVDRESERAALLDLLQAREARLEAVVERLFTSQEDERRRVSQDLHDGVAQLAGGLFRQIEACAHDLEPPDRRRLEPAIEIARTLIGELRAIIGGLRPPALDDLGLAAAVGVLLDPLRAEGFAVTFEICGEARPAASVETGFYRVAQEALTNVRKHGSKPCAVHVRLEMTESTITLTVRDDGPGFDPALGGAVPGTAGHRIGLQVMRERMAGLGGGLVIETAPGSGTCVTASLSRGGHA